MTENTLISDTGERGHLAELNDSMRRLEARLSQTLARIAEGEAALAALDPDARADLENQVQAHLDRLRQENPEASDCRCKARRTREHSFADREFHPVLFGDAVREHARQLAIADRPEEARKREAEYRALVGRASKRIRSLIDGWPEGTVLHRQEYRDDVLAALVEPDRKKYLDDIEPHLPKG